ncbi:membrane protein [Kitasatospora sp. NE20-6]|uniref:PP2C family protein-serine/threonine phosphatase n=1 Tax=Kitasatospora sp. NE20-6 TaxID=2859066 RepID=UPI0034DBCE17
MRALTPPSAARARPGGAHGTAQPHRTSDDVRAPLWVLLLPVLLLVVDLVFDFGWPVTTAAGFLLTVLPVVSAFGYGPLAVAGSTVLAVGLQILLATRAGHLSEQHHVWIYIATTLAGIMGTALSWQRLRRSRDLVRVRSIADTLQYTVLRPVPARVGSLRTVGRYRPAHADIGVGGDLYEVCETRFGTRVLLGDVRGKGLDAVRTVADVLGAFRVTAHETADLCELADQLDRQVLRDAAEGDDDELFVTAVLLQHRPEGLLVELVNRGHLDPLLLTPAGVRPVRCPECLPLGLGHLGGESSAPVAVELPPGHTLLLHTDGVSEARDANGEFYPLTERLTGLGSTDPAVVVDFLDRDVRLHAGSLGDDLAVLALSPAGS